MSDFYIEPVKAYNKLKIANSMKQSVYVCGATGFGKTALVKNFFKDKKYTYYSVIDDDFRGIEYNEKKDSIIIVDDIQFLRDEGIRSQVVKLINNEKVTVILVGRCFVPHWLMTEYIAGKLLVIDEDDIRLDKKSLKLFFANNKINLSDDQLEQVVSSSEGNGFVCNYTVRRINDGVPFEELLAGDSWRVFAEYLENNVISMWDSEMLDFLMKISIVDEFTLPLAEVITSSHHMSEMLDRALETGSFLTRENDVYKVRPVLLTALRGRLEKVYGTEKIRELEYNAGLYYEMQDEIVKALNMYQLAQKPQKIKELLIKNAKCKLGTSNYFALKKQYFDLEDWEVEENIYLMTGMSMLYSLLMLPDKSEYWRRRLQEYSLTSSGAELREVKGCLSYLAIALPHINGSEMEQVLVDVSNSISNVGIVMPEFPVTGYLPSVLNSGKDFSNWMKRDVNELLSMEFLIKKVLGKYGLGFSNVMLAEILYEKGEELIRILQHITQAQIEVGGGGTLELDFAAVGIQTRVNLFFGNIDTSKEILMSFKKRAIRDDNKSIIQNVAALETKLALCSGNLSQIDAWIKTAPNEKDEFVILDRLCYLVKIRVYILKGRFLDAISLIEKLNTYAKSYNRIYVEIETYMLSAITKYRMGQSWIADFKRCVDLAHEYGFVRVIAEEGAAIVPLIDEFIEMNAGNALLKVYLSKLLSEAKNIQLRYPAYLKSELSSPIQVTGNALQVLKLLAEGYSKPQIAEKMNMKLETVRYHTKELYKKLGAAGKTDAVQLAKSMGII